MSMEGSSKLLARRRAPKQHTTSSRLRRQTQLPPNPDPWCDGGGGRLASAPSWLQDGLPQPASTGASFQLVVSSKGELLGRHTFGQALVQLGRSPSCELTLDHPTVSRFHAVIERSGPETWVIRDLRSCNGVKINGSRVEERELRDRDVIRMGDIQLDFQRPGAPAPELDFGRTLVGPSAPAPADRAAARGYLSAQGLTKGGVRVCQLVLDSDTFVIGGGEVDLPLEARLTPRVVAVILRTARGFSLDPVAGWPWGPRLNGRRIDGVEPLEDGDVIAVPGKRLTFRLGLPS